MPSVIDGTLAIVCGGRAYSNRTFVYDTLDFYFSKIPYPLALIHGGCTGADTIAHDWAVERGVFQVPVGAPWDALAKAVSAIVKKTGVRVPPEFTLGLCNWAGPLRNDIIVKAAVGTNAKRRVLIAFPGDRGTADCVRRARATNAIDVIEMREP